MPPDEEKRRKSIAYILRRRKRGRKVRANSKDVVKSWAEYSEVNFKPTGGYSPWWRILLVFIVPLIVLSPAIIIGASQGAQDLVDRVVPATLWVLLTILAIVLSLTTLFFVAYAGLTVWRTLESVRPHKNE